MQDDGTIEQLSAYLDGELTDNEVAELEHRLARDPGLQSELDSLRAAMDLMRTHGPVQAPAALYGDILRAVEDEPMPGGFWAWLQRPFGLPLPAVALAAVGLLVVGVAITGAVAVNATGALRPAVSDLEYSSVSPKGDKKGDSNRDLMAQAPEEELKGEARKDASPAVRGKAAPAAEVNTDAVADVGDVGDAEEAGLEKLSYDKKKELSGLEPVEQAAEVGTAGSAEGGSYSGSMTQSVDNASSTRMYSGHSLTSIALRPEDLERVAALYQKHAGLSKSSASVAERIASMESGTRDFELTLPDEKARQAFELDLNRLFSGRVSNGVSRDVAFTMDHARMTLRLTVSSYAPATGGEADPIQMQTLRKAKDAWDENEPAEAPDQDSKE